MKRLVKKLVQGLTAAFVAVTGANLAVWAIIGRVEWLSFEAVWRVGLTSFVAGILFFPVDAKALKSRFGFALRAFLATAGASVAHHVLFGLAYPELNMWPHNWAEAFFAQAPWGLNWFTWLPLAAMTGAATAAWLAQPALQKLAGGQPRRPALIQAMDATPGRPVPQRVR